MKIFSILVILASCGEASNQDGKAHVQNDSLRKTTTNIELTMDERRKHIEEENRIDSIRFDIALKDALKIAIPAFKSNSFKRQYEIQPDDSSYAINIEILIGRFFNDNQRYFLLRRKVPWTTFINLYRVIDDKTEKVIEREQGGMTYIRDTIFDVNGDGHKDFLVHWYPSSGCCRRNVYNVYLNQPNKGIFTQDYEFINPTFSAREKVIRGVGYGHSGEVGLYKYKWHGLQVDTIEFIYPVPSTKGQFIKIKKGRDMLNEKEGIVLKAIPKEYHNIESYEWFAGFLN
jgi:hypothetical protein